MLHWKNDSSGITQSDLDDIYNLVFGTSEKSTDGNALVVDIIRSEADNCLNDGDGINFENKIVLSIAIRIVAEQFLINKISDPNFVSGIELNQTPALLKKFKEKFSSELDDIAIIQQVILMTPENIHLNSFMYEPILDMSDEHLRRLYEKVLTLLQREKVII